MENFPNSASYQTLLEQFELTKKQLGDAEEHIKRITGRNADQFTDSQGGPALNKWKAQTGLTPGKQFIPRNKRPLFPIIKGKDEMIGQDEESPDEDETPAKRPSLPSTVVATPKDIKSRKETIQEQNINSKVKARNRRMFGMILGTLQKFQHDAKKREEKDLKRAEVEQKVEAAAAEEKERIKKEKEELFQTRKEKQIQLRCLEKKMEITELHEVWENNQKKLANFMVTKTEPPIYFLPAIHTPATDKCLLKSKTEVLERIRERREKLQQELLQIEEWYKKDHFPSDKENIGPMEDNDLIELTDTQQEQDDSHQEVTDAHQELLDTTQEVEATHEELHNTHHTPQNCNQEFQNVSHEVQEAIQKENVNAVLIKTENVVNSEETSNGNNEENVANGDADQDFEPIYD